MDVKARVGYDISIDDKSFFLDYKKYDLLSYINESNSMVKASEKCNVSYRTTLNYINQIENALDISIVDTKKGGTGGGGSTALSPEGQMILKECEKINALLELHQDFNEIESTVTDIKRENGIMEIEINPNFRLNISIKDNYEIGDKLLALISYDNVFISLNYYKSSIRNLFKGKIMEMSINGEMIRVKIDVGGTYFYSDITVSAQKDLDLKLGKEVYIGFKAVSVATMKL